MLLLTHATCNYNYYCLLEQILFWHWRYKSEQSKVLDLKKLMFQLGGKGREEGVKKSIL